jgi:penicillin-binding protein 2
VVRLSYPIERSRDPDRIQERERDLLLRRADGLRVFFLLLFGALVFRLYSLQFLSAEHYAQKALENVEKKIVTDPVRGRIFDRDGSLLVSNEPYYRLILDRSWGGQGADGISMNQCRKSLAHVAELLGWEESKKERILELVPLIYRGSVPENRLSPNGYVILEHRLTFPQIVRIEENAFELPGIRIEERDTRKYYKGRLACHLLGYTGPISSEDFRTLKEEGYRMTDWIGRDGLERAFDKELRGKRGVSWQRRYANNIVEEEILDKRVPPTPGEDFYLSLDLGLQELAEEILGASKGGIAAVDPYTGQVLALASAPGFDLNLFRGGIRPENYKRLLEDPGNPFVDRATGKGGGGGYPPGSVFKIVTTLAAVEEQLVSDETTYHCGGGIPVGRRWKRCHKRSGHGPLDLFEGFARSCDVYYYKTGELVGPNLLAKYARGLGLGSPTGLPEVLHETSGLIPDPNWKRFQAGYGKWGRTDTLNTAIGQGFVLVSPLQMAMVTAYVGNRGTLLAPQIVSHRRDGEGNLVWRAEPKIRESIPVSTETIDLVRDCMQRVVESPSGTGRRVKIEGLTIAGKTGTAEHYAKPSDAWFCCYAPAERPEIALAVAIEGGGHGGETAAPLAKRLLEYHFRDRLQPASERVAIP